MPLNFAGFGQKRGGGLLDYLMREEASSYYAGKRSEERTRKVSGALKKLYGDLSDEDLDAVAELAAMGYPVSQGYLDRKISQDMIKETLANMDPEIAEAIKVLPFDQQRTAIYNLKMSDAEKKKKAQEALVAKNALMKYYNGLPKNSKGYPDFGKMSGEEIYNLTYLVQHSDPDIISQEQLDPLMNMFLFGQFQDPRQAAKQTAKGAASAEKLSVLNDIWTSGRVDGSYLGLKPKELMVVSDLFNINGAEDWEKFKGNPVFDIKTRTAAENVIWNRLTNIAKSHPRVMAGFPPEAIINDWIAGKLDESKYPTIAAEFAKYLDPQSGDIYMSMLVAEAEKFYEMGKQISRLGKVGESDKKALTAIRIIQAKGYDNETDLRNWMRDFGLVDVQIDFIIENLADIDAGNLDKVIEKLKEL